MNRLALTSPLNDKVVRQLNRLSTVPRWVIIPTLNKQSVAEHSFNVAWIYVWVCGEIKQHPTGDGLLTALAHDRLESVTGDMPSTTKPKTSDYYMGLDLTEILVKLADILEASMFIQNEADMGNCKVARSVFGHLKEQGAHATLAARKKVRHIPAYSVLLERLLSTTKIDRHPSMEDLHGRA